MIFGKGTMAQLVLVAFVVLGSTVPSWARTYTTSFPVTEAPLSEGGRWINGGNQGLHLANVNVNVDGAYGTQTGTAGGPHKYGDSTAVVTGSWGPDQTASVIVRSTNQPSTNVFEEIEVRLRTTISAHAVTGYEFLVSLNTRDAYCHIVRWNGALGDFTPLGGHFGPIIRTGDVITATAVGSTLTLYVNNVKCAQAIDSTFRDGSPGIGFYFQTDGSGTNHRTTDYGITSFTADDGVSGSTNHEVAPPPASTPAVAPPQEGSPLPTTAGLAIGSRSVSMNITPTLVATRCELWVDGVKQAEDNSAPYVFRVDPRTWGVGDHAVQGKCFSGSSLSEVTPVMTWPEIPWTP